MSGQSEFTMSAESSHLLMVQSGRKSETSTAFRWYVLLLLLLSYIVSLLDRYLLSVCTVSLATDLGYGDQTCKENAAINKTSLNNIDCRTFTEKHRCLLGITGENRTVCEWVHTGTGSQYDLLVGPVFFIPYTIAGIPLSVAGDYYNRIRLVTWSVFLWSLITVLNGAVNAYWQLVLLRFALGIFESGCLSLAASILADYFPAERRALVLIIYNWGSTVSYGLTFVMGSYITEANIHQLGWRCSFYLSGAIGVGLGILIHYTVPEPERRSKKEPDYEVNLHNLIGRTKMTWARQVKRTVACFCQPALLMLCIAGAIRNIAGYVWSFYAEVHYEMQGEEPTEIATYLSWLPVVGGTLSVLLGGFISVKVTAVHHGSSARICCIISSLILAVPFAACSILVSPPAAFFMLIPAYMFGEIWVGLSLAVVIDLVPPASRTSSIGFYLFILINIGGLGSMCVSPIQTALSHAGFSTNEAFKYTLLILYPGGFLISGILYLSSLYIVLRDTEVRNPVSSVEPVRMNDSPPAITMCHTHTVSSTGS